MKTHLSVIGKLLLSYAIVIIGVFILALASILVNIAAGNGTVVFDEDFGGWTLYAQTVLFVLSAMLMHAAFERKKGWSLGIRQPRAVPMTVQGMGAGIALISLSAVLIWLFGGAQWTTVPFTGDVAAAMAEGALLFICVAVSEEIFSRGYMQGLLRYHYGGMIAMIVSSAVFALMHGMNDAVFSTPFPIINLFLAGFLMALARELTGGLWWPIGLHLTWNYVQGHIYGFKVSGTVTEGTLLQAEPAGPVWLSGGDFGIEGSLLSVIMLVAGCAGVYFLYRRKPVSGDPSLANFKKH